MKKYFLKLYQYNAWANKRVIDNLSDQKVADEKVLTLMGHILAAQSVWFNRIQGRPSPHVKLWGEYSLSGLVAMAQQGANEWLAFVEGTENFDREMTYKNFAGEAYTSNVENVMIHVVNHASYHRAQIALLLRQKGMEPVNTDFIIYERVMTGQLKE